MSIFSSASYDVADSATASGSVSLVVQPPVGFGTGGKGKLVHPTLGDYVYWNTPDETVNFDNDVIFGPEWVHAKTLTSGAETLWAGKLRDAVVTERWVNGDVGSVITHLRALYTFFANPPAPGGTNYVKWYPNYATASYWYVVMAQIRSGGQEYTINRRLSSYGYAPTPVENVMRIIAAGE